MSTAATQDWETVLRPSILSVCQVAPERLELNALYDNIKVLGASAQKTRSDASARRLDIVR